MILYWIFCTVTIIVSVLNIIVLSLLAKTVMSCPDAPDHTVELWLCWLCGIYFNQHEWHYKPGQISAGGHIGFISQRGFWFLIVFFWLWGFVPVPSSTHILPFTSPVVWWWLSRQMVPSVTAALTPVSIQPGCVLYFPLYYLCDGEHWALWLSCESDWEITDVGLFCFIVFFAETTKKGTVVSRANSIGSTSASSVPNTGIL